MIRPEAQAALWRWREVGVGMAVLALGLWLMRLGGYLLLPLGATVALAGLALGVLAWRRLQFVTAGAAPGVVQLDEGQISYMGPQVGGFVSLRDLVELRLISLRGRRLWRLKQADGQALLIPVEAAGAEALFDAFSSLPGLSSAALVAALAPVPGSDSRALMAGGENRVIWRRAGRGVVTGSDG
ncbi:hypothetical protein [Pseudorhodobacter sp. MZDSW-24AT]|uniref:hypothetical protein n=1 Tax=Pseudorhodobacter sp. MZDSW-24AT TaxID=2052957 RepID=UPI000C1E1040|nr:hypothetical protein [Pseudorhodobacter sp. MZDSW-24AT]PJF08380.1 hypothetical protein CUR21_15510 [Pseudorhodobacter sp. MZDSW-24AT]